MTTDDLSASGDRHISMEEPVLGSRIDRRRFALALPAVATIPAGFVTIGPVRSAPENRHLVLGAADESPATPSADGPLTGDDVEAAIELALADLADAGVAVFVGPTDEEPVVPVPDPGPLRLLLSQVRTMAVEAAGAGGLIGSELDALAGYPLPPTTDDPAEVPVADWRSVTERGLGSEISARSGTQTASARPSELVIAYVAVGDSPGAVAARRYLPDISDDRDAMVAAALRVVFPSLVLTLMVSEIARADAALDEASLTGPALQMASIGGVAPGTARCGTNTRRTLTEAVRKAAEEDGVLAQGGLDAPCSAVSNFIDSVLGTVVDALTKGFRSLGLPSLLEIPLSWLLGLATDAIRAAIQTLLAPIVAEIRGFAAIIGTAVMVVSAIRPWTARMRSTPITNRLAVGTEAGRPGSVRCLIDLGGLDEWPPVVADCAAAAGLKLPPLKPVGSRIDWSYRSSRDGLIAVVDQPKELDAAGAAELQYITGSESERTARGPARVGTVLVTAQVARKQFDELRDTILNLAFGALPAIVQPFVRSILGGPADALLRNITAITDTRGFETFYVTYHDEPEPSEEPEPDSGQAGALNVTFPLAFDALVTAELTLAATSCDRVAWDGTLHFANVLDPADAENVLGISIDDTLPISWSFGGRASATASVGPFIGSASTIYGPDTVYEVTFDLALTEEGVAGNDSGGTITVDGTFFALVDGTPQSTSLDALFSGIGEPVPVTDGDAC